MSYLPQYVMDHTLPKSVTGTFTSSALHLPKASTSTSLITSPPTLITSTTSSRPNTECFIPSFLESKLKQLQPRIQVITTSNVAVAAHMETEAITEYWFGEEAKGSDWSGGQCGHGDVRVEEEGDGNDDDES
ncbi:hypothetical protein AHAS_Ahas09G0011400 [Arachis hypogaea]